MVQGGGGMGEERRVQQLYSSLPVLHEPQTVGEAFVGRVNTAESCGLSAPTTQPSGRPVNWVDNAGSRDTGISQLLFPSVELSPFPWPCRRKNTKKSKMTF
jgi:hypothetical protein